MMVAGAVAAAPLRAADQVDWSNVNNDKAGTRYAGIDQINRDNVKQLTVAWTYSTGDAGPGTTIECTPLVVGGVMYLTTVRTKVIHRVQPSVMLTSSGCATTRQHLSARSITAR